MISSDSYSFLNALSNPVWNFEKNQKLTKWRPFFKKTKNSIFSKTSFFIFLKFFLQIGGLIKNVLQVIRSALNAFIMRRNFFSEKFYRGHFRLVKRYTCVTRSVENSKLWNFQYFICIWFNSLLILLFKWFFFVFMSFFFGVSTHLRFAVFAQKRSLCLCFFLNFQN